MIASTQITNTEIFAFISVFVFSYWAVSRKEIKLLQSKLLLKKLLNLTGKLLQNLEKLENWLLCEYLH